MAFKFYITLFSDYLWDTKLIPWIEGTRVLDKVRKVKKATSSGSAYFVFSLPSIAIFN